MYRLSDIQVELVRKDSRKKPPAIPSPGPSPRIKYPNRGQETTADVSSPQQLISDVRSPRRLADGRYGYHSSSNATLEPPPAPDYYSSPEDPRSGPRCLVEERDWPVFVHHSPTTIEAGLYSAVREIQKRNKIKRERENASAATEGMKVEQRTQSVGAVDLRLEKLVLEDEYRDVEVSYRLGKQVGVGACGIVRKCTQKATNMVFACKTISKEGLKRQMDVRDLVAEVQTMRVLQSHPYIARLEDVYEDTQAVHLVMEYCGGGDLFGRIKKLQHYSERDAAIVCASLASVLEYAHSQGVMHRDIKPENILLVSSNSNTEIRLADFGSATFFRPGQKLNQLIGSPLYVAPSVLNNDYGPEADLWSLGVVLYIMLCGTPPFWGKTNAQIFKKVQSGQLSMSGPRWANVSHSAKDLVKQLLTTQDEARLTAEEVRRHPWIQLHCMDKVVDFTGQPSVNPQSNHRRVKTNLPEMNTLGHRRGISLGPISALHLEYNKHGGLLTTQQNVDLYRSVLGRKPSSFQSSSYPDLGDSGDDADEDIPVAMVLPDIVSRQFSNLK